MIGSPDCSVAGGTLYVVTWGAVHSGAGVAVCFGAGGTECFVAGGTEYLRAHPWLLSLQTPYQSSSCSSSFLQMGQCGPHEHFLVAYFGVTITQGITTIWGGASVLMVGAGMGTGVGGISKYFLVSNKFSEADPVLGQGVHYLNWGTGYVFQWWRVGVLG